jgi:carboxylesterase
MTGITLPKPYNGDEHESFLWQAGDHAALLVHGFPGTPAEMRPLGTVLRDAGWTVHGLMLPGLGADIANLEKRSFEDWSEAASKAMEDLKQKHSLVILVGYSMGAAVALHTAMEQPPAGLILLAPFWSFGAGWMRILLPVVKLLFPRVKPLKHVNFSTTAVRHGLQRMFKNIDLDNPRIQEALRKISVSLSPIAQVRKLGLSAFDRASKIDIPTLVIQGSQDKMVRPLSTARLIKRLPNIIQYQEVNAGHDLIELDSGAWTQVKDCLLVFAELIRTQTRIPINKGAFK